MHLGPGVGSPDHRAVPAHREPAGGRGRRARPAPSSSGVTAKGEKAVAGFDWKKPKPLASSAGTRLRKVRSLARHRSRTWRAASAARGPRPARRRARRRPRPRSRAPRPDRGAGSSLGRRRAAPPSRPGTRADPSASVGGGLGAARLAHQADVVRGRPSRRPTRRRAAAARGSASGSSGAPPRRPRRRARRRGPAASAPPAPSGRARPAASRRRTRRRARPRRRGGPPPAARPGCRPVASRGASSVELLTDGPAGRVVREGRSGGPVGATHARGALRRGDGGGYERSVSGLALSVHGAISEIPAAEWDALHAHEPVRGEPVRPARLPGRRRGERLRHAADRLVPRGTWWLRRGGRIVAAAPAYAADRTRTVTSGATGSGRPPPRGRGSPSTRSS